MVNTTTTATDDKYYYEFRYVYDDVSTVMKFNADITFQKLLYNFANFAKGCSWQDITVEEYIKTAELDIF